MEKTITPRTFERGHIFVKENELSRRMYVLAKGKVRVYKTYFGQKVTLAILNEGEIFGEMSFIDAQPRSATVEAITPCEVFVIEADEAERQLSMVPGWIRPVLKTAFSRLRTADTRTMVLQAATEFEKRHFKRDSLAEVIYSELLRFNKLLMLVHGQIAAKTKTVSGHDLLDEIDIVLSNRAISLQAYWKLLKEYDFIDREQEEATGEVVLRVTNLRAWIDELEKEISAKTYTVLSHSGVAVLKRIMTHLDDPDAEPEDAKKNRVKLSISHIGIDSMPLYTEALDELEKQQLIVRPDVDHVSVVPREIIKVATYQSLIKYFDYSIHHAA